ncbi:hypothetical protein WR25_06482 [Diploscapter pachys]|uniref:Uncharacterized protein n=1 Tax=Diploscapter pachys TaxID=2018661 RepID=A0A2A2M3K1_9BILA|nr:hypothetical protein WR25_06482 [Diploscapter pachys]
MRRRRSRRILRRISRRCCHAAEHEADAEDEARQRQRRPGERCEDVDREQDVDDAERDHQPASALEACAEADFHRAADAEPHADQQRQRQRARHRIEGHQHTDDQRQQAKADCIAAPFVLAHHARRERDDTGGDEEGANDQGGGIGGGEGIEEREDAERQRQHAISEDPGPAGPGGGGCKRIGKGARVGHGDVSSLWARNEVIHRWFRPFRAGRLFESGRSR